MTMTRILWFGDAADTGFGTVTKNIGARLLAQGLDVRFILQNVSADPIPEPMGSRSWDASRISPDDLRTILTRGFRDGWKPERAVIILDYLAARGLIDGLELREVFAPLRPLHYMPVEGIGFPPTWKSLWDVLEPVAMSQFGANELSRLLGRQVPLIYHGVDQAQFYPVTAEQPIIVDGRVHIGKEQAKAFFGLDPSRVYALRTDRNMPRKRYASLLRAITPAMEQVPNLDLIIHCRPQDQGGDLYDMVSKLPGSLNGRVIFTTAHDTWRGLPANALALLYNAADFYVSTSAEGFGLTIAESLACGTPAIGMDYSAVPEVIGPAGIIVPCAGLIDNEYSHYWGAIDEAAMTGAIIDLATHRGKRRRLGALGPDHIRRHFDWDQVASAFAGLVSDERLAAVS